MSNKPYKGFEPKWLLTPAPAGSYRSIFRWGDPEFFKYPKESLYKMMKEAFHMTDEDFRDYTDDIGFDQVSLPDHPSRIAPEHLEALKKIVGEEFVTTGDYERLSVAYGCTGYDLLRLRHKQIDSLPDVVVCVVLIVCGVWLVKGPHPAKKPDASKDVPEDADFCEYHADEPDNAALLSSPVVNENEVTEWQILHARGFDRLTGGGRRSVQALNR